LFYYYGYILPLLYSNLACNIAVIRIFLVGKILIIENLRLSFLARHSTPYFYWVAASASLPFLFAFFRRDTSDRAVIARECIHREPPEREAYFISVSRPKKDERTHVLHSKPWPESLVIRPTVSSLNEVR